MSHDRKAVAVLAEGTDCDLAGCGRSEANRGKRPPDDHNGANRVARGQNGAPNWMNELDRHAWSAGTPLVDARRAHILHCWISRADGFTVSRSQPTGIATDLLFSIQRRVNTAFCPCGVGSPGVCLVSATQVLDHVPLSPAEPCCISLSHCRPGPGRARH
jgi:hypothetical protein